MKCFYHAAADAVGSCKHCHRGVCRDCAAERDGGIACRGRCEGQVDQVNALIQRNIQVGVRSRPMSLIALAVFLGAFCVLIYLAMEEENASVRIMYILLAAFSFIGLLGQLSILKSWLSRRRMAGR